VALRVLTWNLYHGRALPPAGRSLLGSYGAALAGWEWDVALLQEVPPWWPPALAVAARAEQRTALTSRNAALAVRRAIAVRAPDLIKSNGGGANAILSRRPIRAHARRRVCLWPERRMVHAVALADGTWVGNLHATVHDDAAARRDAARAAGALLGWAGSAPAALGGDLNVRDPEVPGLAAAGGHGVDHVFARGLRATGPPEVLEHDPLSDHAPVLVSLELQPRLTSSPPARTPKPRSTSSAFSPRPPREGRTPSCRAAS